MITLTQEAGGAAEAAGESPTGSTGQAQEPEEKMAKRRGKPEKRRCVDCVAAGITTDRPTPYGGPRSPLCVTHHRQRKKRTSARNHARRTQTNFSITAAQYQLLYESQGGCCFICRHARGISKRLAVDHEHHRPGCDHPPERGCPRCIRALLCSSCNVTIGRLGVEALQRAIVVLTDPPARRVLKH